jgi:hypothetical protein
MQFREHSDTIAESIQTIVTLKDRQALVEHCQTLLTPLGFRFEPDTLTLTYYSDMPDTRVGWEQTYIVIIEGHGVIGFSDSPD